MDSTSPSEQPTEPQGVGVVLNQDYKKKKILFEIALIIILLILVLGFLNYFNIIPLSSTFPNQFGFLPHRIEQITNKPYSNLCAKFQKTQAKISCEKALELALAQSPGNVQKVSLGKVVIPVVQTSGNIKTSKEDMWLIDIVLTNPYFDDKFNKQINILQVGVNLNEYSSIFKKPLE